MIELQHVSLGYGRETVLEDVSLIIKKGGLILFTGSNGAGKTTLLHGIIGLLKPFKGTISTPFQIKPPAYVPQFWNIDIINPIIVRDVIMMGAYLKKYNTLMNQEQISSFGLTKYLDKSYRTLSGGFKQRTLLLRAIMLDSDILILDEATSQLDHQSENFIMDTIFNLNKAQDMTVLMVSHHYDLLHERYRPFIKYKVENKKIERLT